MYLRSMLGSSLVLGLVLGCMAWLCVCVRVGTRVGVAHRNIIASMLRVSVCVSVGIGVRVSVSVGIRVRLAHGKTIVSAVGFRRYGWGVWSGLGPSLVLGSLLGCHAET